MKRFQYLPFVLVMFLYISGAGPLGAQGSESDYRLRGMYVRAGYLSFNVALILNWDERELMLHQDGRMPSIGVGYAWLPRGGGLSVNAQYAHTTLEPFRTSKGAGSGGQGPTGPTLSYSEMGYSMLLFDFDVYVVPARQLPVAIALGGVMGGSFQSYSIVGDNEVVQNANGSKSTHMFRYGYKLGVKVMPIKLLSIDLEYRPMSAYTTTISYHDYLYTKDGWDYYGYTTSKSGPSERLLAAALSVHF